MKIVGWNCTGKFREKYRIIQELDADIYVIQECEDPQKIKHNDYASFAGNYLWFGENKNKGLGIFARDGVLIEDNNWDAHYLRCFISAKINKDFNLLGVWACKPYIEEYCVYQSIHYENYNKDMIIMGDFNSNAIWDKNHRKRNFSHVVEKLKDKGLISAYHFTKGEKLGQESKNTFYMYRNPNKGYHIDYVFANEERIEKFRLLDDTFWLSYSDHVPIILDIKLFN